jgi:thioredoxin-dependent peroxiredoxin
MIAEGSPAPDFELKSDSGESVSLASLRGKPVVLYFYPRDDTPGCTAEACEFRDAFDEFRARGVEILGVSPDTEASHAKFKSKHELPFRLLADPEHAAAEAYGVWQERTMYGRKSMGIKRSTFLIDAEGRVAKAMIGIRPAGHAAQVLQSLSQEEQR